MSKTLARVVHGAGLALAAAFVVSTSVFAANDWVNFATVSMTNPTTPKLTGGYGCYTDGKDVLCDSAPSAITFGTGGLIDMGGLTVAGSVSAAAVSATYVSGTVIQVNASTMPCSTGLNGAIRYSSTSNTLQVCIGTTWSSLSSNTTPGNANVAGANTNVQYNNNGALGGDSNFTYVSATGTVSASGAYYSGDSNAYFYNNLTTPALVFDANDYLRYTRASNVYDFLIGGNPMVTINGSGNLLVNNLVSATLFYGANGTVGAPTYSFANDTNSGFYRPASNIIGVSIGSAEVARFTAGGISATGTVNAAQVSSTYTSSTLVQVGGGAGAGCVAGLNGAIRYNSTSNTIDVCVGTAWTSLNSGTITGSGISGGSATAIAFWNGPNSITYESATTTGLYWDHTNGRLGVGTNAPTNSLHVVGGSGQGNAMILEPNSAGGYSGNTLQFRRASAPSNTGWAIGGDIPGSSANVMTDDLIFSSYSGVLPWVERMRIVSGSGYVGIGNGSPTATLQVSGTFTVSFSTQTTTPSLFVSGGGQLGIGTNNPSTTVDIGGFFGLNPLPGYYTDIANNAVWYSGDWRSKAGGPGSLISMQGGSQNGWLADIVFSSSGSPTSIAPGASLNMQERMRLKSNGSLGIGTASPGSSLTVVGEVQVSSSGAACVTATNGGAIRYSAGTLYYCNGSNTWTSIGSGGGTLTGGGSATAIAFWNGTNSLTYESITTSGLYWDHTNGRLGIGNNVPVAPLDVSGSAVVGADIARFLSSGLSSGQFVQMFLGRATSSGETATWTYTEGASGGIASFGLYGNRIMLNLNAAGNVGVATMSPTATLQVSGTFVVSQTGQNSLASASLAVDSRGVSVSSIVHINGSPFSPIGAGGNAILSGTTAVSTSSAGSITFSTGGSQRLGIDSTGKIGIGTPTPTTDVQIYKAATTPIMSINGDVDQGSSFRLYSAGADKGEINFWGASTGGGRANNLEFINIANGADTFWTNSLERMRIDSSGNLFIGTTSATPNPGFVFTPSGAMAIGTNASANGWAYVNFERSGGSIGSISQNTNTSVAYNTTSDRRVKENITDTREGLQKLMQIGVKDFSFKADPSHTIVNGFIAQELNKVYPDAVTTNGDNGEVLLKDKSRVWSVDYGRVTPLIVKAVQDLKHLVDGNQTANDLKLKAANDNIQVLTAAVKAQGEKINALTAEVKALRAGR